MDDSSSGSEELRHDCSAMGQGQITSNAGPTQGLNSLCNHLHAAFGLDDQANPVMPVADLPVVHGLRPLRLPSHTTPEARPTPPSYTITTSPPGFPTASPVASTPSAPTSPLEVLPPAARSSPDVAPIPTLRLPAMSAKAAAQAAAAAVSAAVPTGAAVPAFHTAGGVDIDRMPSLAPSASAAAVPAEAATQAAAGIGALLDSLAMEIPVMGLEGLKGAALHSPMASMDTTGSSNDLDPFSFPHFSHHESGSASPDMDFNSLPTSLPWVQHAGQQPDMVPHTHAYPQLAPAPIPVGGYDDSWDMHGSMHPAPRQLAAANAGKAGFQEHMALPEVAHAMVDGPSTWCGAPTPLSPRLPTAFAAGLQMRQQQHHRQMQPPAGGGQVYGFTYSPFSTGLAPLSPQMQRALARSGSMTGIEAPPAPGHLHRQPFAHELISSEQQASPSHTLPASQPAWTHGAVNTGLPVTMPTRKLGAGGPSLGSPNAGPTTQPTSRSDAPGQPATPQRGPVIVGSPATDRQRPSSLAAPSAKRRAVGQQAVGTPEVGLLQASPVRLHSGSHAPGDMAIKQEDARQGQAVPQAMDASADAGHAVAGPADGAMGERTRQPSLTLVPPPPAVHGLAARAALAVPPVVTMSQEEASAALAPLSPAAPNKNKRGNKPGAAASAAGAAAMSVHAPVVRLALPQVTDSRQTPQARTQGGTSHYRGVTRHRHTQRYEAHLWDSSAQRATKGKGGRTRGKQIYLGGFATDEEAARAYDRAALAFWGDTAQLNFLLSDYADELTTLRAMSREECVAWLRRGSSGFARGVSRYRGVTRHHQHGRWESRIGRVGGKKYMYLGTFDTEREAAVAYDHAVLLYRDSKTVTNFPVAYYSHPISGEVMPLDEVLQACTSWPEPEAPPPATDPLAGPHASSTSSDPSADHPAHITAAATAAAAAANALAPTAGPDAATSVPRITAAPPRVRSAPGSTRAAGRGVSTSRARGASGAQRMGAAQRRRKAPSSDDEDEESPFLEDETETEESEIYSSMSESDEEMEEAAPHAKQPAARKQAAGRKPPQRGGAAATQGAVPTRGAAGRGVAGGRQPRVSRGDSSPSAPTSPPTIVVPANVTRYTASRAAAPTTTTTVAPMRMSAGPGAVHAPQSLPQQQVSTSTHAPQQQPQLLMSLPPALMRAPARPSAQGSGTFELSGMRHQMQPQARPQLMAGGSGSSSMTAGRPTAPWDAWSQNPATRSAPAVPENDPLDVLMPSRMPFRPLDAFLLSSDAPGPSQQLYREQYGLLPTEHSGPIGAWEVGGLSSPQGYGFRQQGWNTYESQGHQADQLPIRGLDAPGPNATGLPAMSSAQFAAMLNSQPLPFSDPMSAGGVGGGQAQYGQQLQHGQQQMGYGSMYMGHGHGQQEAGSPGDGGSDDFDHMLQGGRY